MPTTYKTLREAVDNHRATLKDAFIKGYDPSGMLTVSVEDFVQLLNAADGYLLTTEALTSSAQDHVEAE